MSPIRFVLRHQTLRLIAVALLLLGALNASVYPYQSLIAIERIGMSKPAFSLMLAVASLIAVTSSVVFGVLGDQYGRRRVIAMGTTLCSTIGIALMLALPGTWALILCQGVLLPLASSMYGQLFALARLASPVEGRARDGILGTIRSAMSFTFLAMLIFWTFAFGYGMSETAVYISGGLASLGLLLLVWLGWPRDGQTAWADPRSGMRLRDALVEIAKPNVAVRVLLLGALSSAGNLYMVLVSLVFDASPLRGPADVALYVGMVAGWEVPAMLILPRFAHLVPRSTLMWIGAMLYGAHLLALPLLSETPWLWIMTAFAGVGGAVIITTPISYYQDLLRDRPGTAASMLAVQKLVADILTAAIFAIGTQVHGFETVAVMGVAVSLTGALGLYFADRKPGFRRAPDMTSGVFGILWRDKALRMIAILMMLQGALVCSFGPYVSVLAVRVFGLGDRGYAAMLVAATMVAVGAALYAGIRADQTANRRQIALGAAGLVMAGGAVMTFAPSAVSFVLAQALLFPANSLFGQLFAQARLAGMAYPPPVRDTIQSTIRALFALPFVVVLPLWALALNRGVPVLVIYPVALALGAAMTLLIWRYWPGQAEMAGRDKPSGLTLRAALAEVASPRLALRIAALGAVSAGGTAYWAVMGLVLTPTHGTGGDAALYAGLVAGLEVPFMLALPLLPRWNRSRLILIGAAIYAIHLIGIPLLAGTPWLWLLLIPAAAGGALTLTIPIAYLQDQLAARPGTGAALMALMKVTGDAMAAAAFALGTGLSGYTLAAVLGAAVTLVGATVLVIADR